jgi:signal transduction histidine kinase
MIKEPDMKNNYDSKDIAAIISITKFCTLLYIILVIKNSNSIYQYYSALNKEFYIIPIVLIIILVLWTFIYTISFKGDINNIAILLEDGLYIAGLSVLILLTGTYNSNYKFLFLFSIISGSINRRRKYGLEIAIYASIFLLSVDLFLTNNLIVNSYFENDILLSFMFIAISLILNNYVKFENSQKELLQMEIDLYKLKKENKESNDLLSESREKNKFITEFFSNISHELKTPLNVIFSSLQMLNLYNENIEEEIIIKRKKYLEIMKQNSLRLIKLINNLLDMTKFDSGFITLNTKNGNIVSLVEDITMSVVSFAENKQIEIIFDTEVEEKQMAFDGDKIERIILNLLSNALKFTNKGGKVFICIYDHEDSIGISVKDTGIGIPKDKQELIFERFGQVDKTLRRNYEGTGIGLSLVQSYVKLHKGKIRVISEIDKGTEFIITLPVYLVEENDNEKKEIEKSIIERANIELSDIYTDL